MLAVVLALPVFAATASAAPLVAPAEIHVMPPSGGGNGRRDGVRPVLQLTALGRDLTIELEPSPLLARWPDALLPADAPTLYRGIVNGEPANWARISVSDGLVSGQLWMEDRLWRLQHRSRLPALPPAAGTLPEGDWLLYDSMALAALDGATDRIATLPSNRAGFRAGTASLTPGEVTRAIRLGIVVDSRFHAYHGQRGLAEALDIVNGVDGLYQAQLGLAVVVEAIRVFDDPLADPLNQPDASVEDLLTRFRGVRLAEPALATDLSLVHLFSGNEDPSRVIGLGWIDTVCRNDGYDVSLSTPFAFSTLLTAHEIAHNLGALHDEDAACAALTDSTRHIMGSRLSGSSLPEFSACSLRDIAPAASAQCLADNIDLHIALRSSLAVQPTQRLVAVQVSNRDATRTARNIGSRTVFPIGTLLGNQPAGCDVNANILTCRHGDIVAGGLSAVSVLATLPSLDSQPVVATLTLDSLVDTNGNDNRAGLDVMLQVQGAQGTASDGNTDGSSGSAGDDGGDGGSVADGSTGSDGGPVVDDMQGVPLTSNTDSGPTSVGDSIPPVTAGATGAMTPWDVYLLALLMLASMRQRLANALHRVHRQRLERQAVVIGGQQGHRLDGLAGDRIGA